MARILIDRLCEALNIESSFIGIVRKLLKLSFLGKTQDADAIVVADVETKDLDTEVSLRFSF